MSESGAFLVQLLLPARGSDGTSIDRSVFGSVQATLAERFGGVTAYLRAPAKGLWKGPDGGVDADQVVMVEVQADTLDREWWKAYRRELERQFRQDTVLMRAIAIEPL